MQSTTFTCTKSAEEIEKSVRERKRVYTLLMWMCPVAIILIGYVLFVPFSDGDQSLAWFPILLFVLTALLMTFCFIVFRKVLDNLPAKYELMPTKELAWDETASQFIYKDKNGTIRFRGDDIERWTSYVNNKSQESTDIILLRTGEKIILEGEWNSELHTYLNNYRNLLGLPEPKRTAWTLDIY